MKEIEEADRQMILLSLGLCALVRPGFHYACGEIAEKFEGRAMFEDFRRLNRDVVQMQSNLIPPIVAQQDAELFDWLTAAHLRGGGFVSTLADAALRADGHNYTLLRPVLWLLKEKYPQYAAPNGELPKAQTEMKSNDLETEES